MFGIMNKKTIIADDIFIGVTMKNKLSAFIVFLAIVLSFSVLYGTKSNFSSARVKAEIVSFEPQVSSKSAILMDGMTETVVYAKNEIEKLPIASMCKIMTLLLCFDCIESGELCFDEDITVSANASGMGGSQVFLEENAVYKVSDLIKSVVVASANDASVALAERISGSESCFVDEMNKKAESLGMNNTVFVNCTGLPMDGQFSCAKDVAIMFSKLIRHKEYFMFSNIWMDKIEHPEGRITEISNTNKLIKYYNGCDCGKTGYTASAGHCLAASAMRNGTRLISVIINASDGKTRFKETADMFDFGFATFVSKKIVDEKTPLEVKVPISGGKIAEAEIFAKDPIFVFTKKSNKRAFEFSYEINEICAPAQSGDVVGKVIVYENGVELARVDAVLREDVERANLFDSIQKTIDNWKIVK